MCVHNFFKPRTATWWLLDSLIVLMCAGVSDVFGQSAVPEKTAVQPAADRATMVVMAPNGPVFADLRISVAKVPYRAWVSKFLATQLDANKDGRLDAKELNLITDSIRRLAEIKSPEKALADISGAASVVDVATADFAKWLQQRLPRAFDLIAQPQAADDSVRLASLIDKDHNGVVADEELRHAFWTLRFRDLDNDETFSVAELLPYRDPRSQNAAVTPDVVSLPFFHITDEASGKAAAERIVTRYGKNGYVAASILRQISATSDSPSSGGLPANTPSSDVELLDVADVEAIVADPDFHLTVDVRLSDRANTSDIDLTVSETAASFCRITDDSFGQTSIVMDGLPLKIVARGGGANNRAVTRGFLGQTFVMIDADRNQYLDETEFAGILSTMQQSGVTGRFEDVDQNSDKMVTRDEVFSFAERDLMAAASRIEVTVKQDGKTLFGLLDANQDRRLSVREIRAGKEVLQKYDLNTDGSFAETELGTEYVLTLGLGRSELRRGTGAMQMMGGPGMQNGDAILPGAGGLSGPEWFRRMDRNQDGDVSAREFPGSADHFRTLDTDQDLLISAAEAEAL